VTSVTKGRTQKLPKSKAFEEHYLVVPLVLMLPLVFQFDYFRELKAKWLRSIIRQHAFCYSLPKIIPVYYMHHLNLARQWSLHKMTI
jgi:hypothetical protein